MNNKNIIKRYTFKPYFSGYFQDNNFYDSEGKLIQRRVYNGCITLNVNKKRYYMRKLRKFAKIESVEAKETNCPF